MQQLTIALIADTLTKEALLHEAKILDITPTNYKSILKNYKIDFLFIERTVIASVKNTVHLMIFVFQRLHKNYIGYIFFVFLGVVIVFCAYFNGVKQ